MPRWLTLASYAAAAVLLIAASNPPAVLIVMPAWTLVISLAVWTGCRRAASPTPSTTAKATER